MNSVTCNQQCEEKKTHGNVSHKDIFGVVLHVAENIISTVCIKKSFRHIIYMIYKYIKKSKPFIVSKCKLIIHVKEHLK